MARVSDDLCYDESRVTDCQSQLSQVLTAVAIAFTVCSMMAALQPIPQECKAWEASLPLFAQEPREVAPNSNCVEVDSKRALCLA